MNNKYEKQIKQSFNKYMNDIDDLVLGFSNSGTPRFEILKAVKEKMGNDELFNKNIKHIDNLIEMAIKEQ